MVIMQSIFIVLCILFLFSLSVARANQKKISPLVQPSNEVLDKILKRLENLERNQSKINYSVEFKYPIIPINPISLSSKPNQLSVEEILSSTAITKISNDLLNKPNIPVRPSVDKRNFKNINTAKKSSELLKKIS